MKYLKQNYLALFITIVSVYSCSQLESINENNFDLYDSKMEQILSESDISVQKMMYNLLDANEKSRYWSGKMEKLLSNKTITDSQFKLIYNLQLSLEPNFFDMPNQTSERMLKKEKMVFTFIEEAVLLFDEAYIYNNFYTLNTPITMATYVEDTEDDGTGGENNGSSNNKCTCSLESYFTCGIGTGIECKRSSWCKKTYDGCGFLWQYACDGRCLL